jgi:hypothetical protein
MIDTDPESTLVMTDIYSADPHAEIRRLRKQVRDLESTNAALSARLEKMNFEHNVAEQALIPPPLAYFRRYRALLTEWDQTFLQSILKWSGRLSAKQEAKLAEIEKKVGKPFPRSAAINTVSYPTIN